MRWPWQRKDGEEEAALEAARKRVNQQRAEIEQQRKVVDEVVNTHREVLKENHLAIAVRQALRNAK
jgi:hypothetical protein